jgi:hypothetical protein
MQRRCCINRQATMLRSGLTEMAGQLYICLPRYFRGGTSDVGTFPNSVDGGRRRMTDDAADDIPNTAVRPLDDRMKT